MSSQKNKNKVLKRSATIRSCFNKLNVTDKKIMKIETLFYLTVKMRKRVNIMMNKRRVKPKMWKNPEFAFIFVSHYTRERKSHIQIFYMFKNIEKIFFYKKRYEFETTLLLDPFSLLIVCFYVENLL